MKKNEIKVGGLYRMKVSGVVQTVRVDAILDQTTGKGRACTTYRCTNLATGRECKAESAAKFRGEVKAEPAPTVLFEKKANMDAGAEHRSDPTPTPIATAATSESSARPAAQPVTASAESKEGKQRSDPIIPSIPPSAYSPSSPAVGNGVSGKLSALMTRPADNASHVEVRALAGTGKTTTVIEGLKLVKGVASTLTPSPQQDAVWQQLALGKSDTVRLSAFNSSITDELKTRVSAFGLDKKGVEARSVHSLGLSCVTKAFPELRRFDLKHAKWVSLDIISEMLGGEYRVLLKQPGMASLIIAADDLVSLCKQTLTKPTPENLDDLIAHYDVEVNGNRQRLYELVPAVLDKCKSPQGRFNFDDMIWLPLVLNLPVPKLDVQIIDEAQDLNRMQQRLVYRGGHRIVFVGDVHQAIYGFAGADAESMPRLGRELGDTPRGCITLPLTVTRRCGKAVVDEARKIVPTFEAHESNPAGSIREARYTSRGRGADRKDIPYEQTYMPLAQDGDMILCRVNAPLVSQCFKFLKRGRLANIQGRKIGDGLVSLVEKLGKGGTVAVLIGKLEEWADKEIATENARKNPSDMRVIAVQDKRECVECFADGCNYASEVVTKIKNTFTDDPNKLGVKLSSIHKSKGLEAKRVFFLEPDGATCPHPLAKSGWQQAQEMNLRYVAITRAIEELIYVS